MDNYVKLVFVKDDWMITPSNTTMLLPFTRNMLFKYLSQYLDERRKRK